MRTIGLLLIVVLVLAAGFLVLRRPSAEQREQAAAAARGLRNAVLSREFVQATGSRPGIRAVVYDWQIGAGTASLVTFDDGSTSVYLIPGGGFIGAGAHENVRRAAAAFRSEAAKALGQFHAITEYPLPAKGYSAFYIVTDSSTLSSGPVRTSDLDSQDHPFAALARLGQEVFTEVRKSS
jgi:hypothetical protein